MITAQEIQDLRKKVPFQPFTLHLSDGRALTLLDPLKCIVTRYSIHIGLPTTAEIAEESELVAFAKIVRVERAESGE